MVDTFIALKYDHVFVIENRSVLSLQNDRIKKPYYNRLVYSNPRTKIRAQPIFKRYMKKQCHIHKQMCMYKQIQPP